MGAGQSRCHLPLPRGPPPLRAKIWCDLSFCPGDWTGTSPTRSTCWNLHVFLGGNRHLRGMLNDEGGGKKKDRRFGFGKDFWSRRKGMKMVSFGWNDRVCLGRSLRNARLDAPWWRQSLRCCVTCLRQVITEQILANVAAVTPLSPSPSDPSLGSPLPLQPPCAFAC